MITIGAVFFVAGALVAGALLGFIPAPRSILLSENAGFLTAMGGVVVALVGLCLMIIGAALR